MRCRDIMKMNLVTCMPTDSVRWCAQVMKDWNIGFLPVVDEERKLVGVLTDRDLAMRVIAAGLPLSTEAREVMTRAVATVSPDSDLVTAEETLAAARKSRVPLVDENGVCHGVISLADVAQAESRRRAGKILQEITRRETTPTSVPWNVI